jgi:hypothetical protein
LVIIEVVVKVIVVIVCGGMTVVGEAHLSKRLLELVHCSGRTVHGSSKSGSEVQNWGWYVWSAKLVG